MPSLPQIGVLSLAALLIGAPTLGLAQDTQNPQPAPAPNNSPTPAQDQGQTKSPSLTTATVKLDNGWRASKTIGSSVYNDQNQQIGSIDDLVLSNDNKVTLAILSVGGFLGIGSKLVAVPYDHLNVGQDRRVTMPGASKETLNSLPNFTYGG
jgi:PRC-barrel domain